MRRFPKLRFDDGKAMFQRKLVNEFGEIFGRRIHIEQIERLVHLAQDFHSRIVAMQDHAVIEIVVDPASDDAFDIREVDHHAAIIELGRLDRDHGSPIVAVQILALAVVIEQSMPVTKINFPANSIHDAILDSRFWIVKTSPKRFVFYQRVMGRVLADIAYAVRSSISAIRNAAFRSAHLLQ